MKDKLEKFIRDNSNKFDDKTPRESSWMRISEALFREKNNGLWNSLLMWRVAAVILLGASVYLYLNPREKTETGTSITMQQQEFSDIELFYKSQISEKIALISTEDVFADDSFTQDIQKLEAMYTVLAEEMKKHPSAKVKDALVLNMLVRIDLLNQQIQKLEESKRSKGRSSVAI